jgi:ribose/xylose/arabinose/galactoside ABC-type transport system permease subunit
VEDPISSLSGGNQQKVLLARWIGTQPQVLILDEPTRGVDVGAKEEIYAEIEKLAAAGVAILCISSDLPEVLRLADRIVVMSQGEVTGELTRAEATEESILELALPRESKSKGEEVHQKSIKLEAWLVGLIAVLFAFTAFKNPSFLELKNLSDMLVKISPTIIVGVGLTFVILAREIDISVGSLMGISAATMGLVSSADRAGLPGWAGILAALTVGGMVGLLNGVLIAYARIPSIIVTLGMFTILHGITELILAGRWVEHLPPMLRTLGTSGAIVWVAIGILVGGWWLLNRTPFGRQVVAIGSDPEASHRIGLPHQRLQLFVFTLTGILTAVATLFSSTQLEIIESGFGNGFEIAAIGAVVVGGTSIRGGKGNVWGTALGAILLGTFGTVLIFLKLGDRAVSFERAFQGLLILVSVLVLGRSMGRRSAA